MKHYLGETIRITVEVKDNDDIPTDPSSITISIYDPDNTAKVSDADMTKESVGEYYYDYAIGETEKTGIWKAIVEAAIGTSTTKDIILFMVEST